MPRSNPGGTGNAVVGNVNFTPWTTDRLSHRSWRRATTDPLICTGQTTDVYINLTKALDVYGYEFEVNYISTYASADRRFRRQLLRHATPCVHSVCWPAVLECGLFGCGTCRFSVVHVAASTARQRQRSAGKDHPDRCGTRRLQHDVQLPPKLTDINSIAACPTPWVRRCRSRCAAWPR